MDSLISRREALERVIALFGGVALVGGDQLLAASFDSATQNAVSVAGIGASVLAGSRS